MNLPIMPRPGVETADEAEAEADNDIELMLDVRRLIPEDKLRLSSFYFKDRIVPVPAEGIVKRSDTGVSDPSRMCECL